MRFKDKVVIVTGAASGFGAAASVGFANEGAKVIAADVNTDGLAQTVSAVQAAGSQAIAVETDVTSGAAIKAMVDAAVSNFGTVDVLINNAGAGHMPFYMHELPEDQYDLMFNLNTKSVYWGVKHVVPVMIENGGGVIVNTASIGAKSPRPKVTAYNAAKGAVVTMTRGLASELARFKIRVNCVCPLASETGFFRSALGVDTLTDEQRKRLTSDVPLRRLTDPNDVANAMLYLASDDGGFITGVSLDIDGGKSI
ncbi:MAG: glucose 1-dehydrogenase [Gammaproteobacteria bacterium]|nr:glucose 1-dehydrogenase [Gammaproteobacteria bacterium]